MTQPNATKMPVGEYAAESGTDRTGYAGADEAHVGSSLLIVALAHDLMNSLTVIKGEVGLLRRLVRSIGGEAGLNFVHALAALEATTARPTGQVGQVQDPALLDAGQKPPWTCKP